MEIKFHRKRRFESLAATKAIFDDVNTNISSRLSRLKAFVFATRWKNPT